MLRKIITYIRYPVLIAVIVLCLVAVAQAATGNIDAVDKWAWGTNVGWINFAPTHGGVTVYSDHLEGYAWGENIGWIRLGTHTGGSPHTYANTTKDNYGVNRDASGNLSGYAWGTSVGWINFNPSHSQVTIDRATGSFDGYAWAENVGWIHFKGTAPVYNVVSIVADTDSDNDGIPDTDDNCPNDPNADQTNSDGDTHGDACDNCSNNDNEDQADGDSDGVGDICDNCPDDANPDQEDGDQDGVGNVCEWACYGLSNDDPNVCYGRGVCVAQNTCTCYEGFDGPNVDQDTCDCAAGWVGGNCDLTDADGDGVPDADDNCTAAPNPGQEDGDGDGVGDICDNCPDDANPGQEDGDGDGTGDACEWWTCDGMDPEDASVCSGRGVCVAQDTCTCDEGFDGANCENALPPVSGTAVSVNGLELPPWVGLVTLAVLAVLGVALLRRRRGG